VKNVRVAAGKHIKLMIDTYGVDIDVLKYVDSATASIYRQRTKGYATAVPIKALVGYDPTEDDLSLIGNADDVVGMITLGRLHLLEAFPLLDPEEAVDKKDELGFDGKRWRVIKGHPTGRLGRGSEVVVIGFGHRPGKKHEVYP
jgi:hypothetical protein